MGALEQKAVAASDVVLPLPYKEPSKAYADLFASQRVAAQKKIGQEIVRQIHAKHPGIHSGQIRFRDDMGDRVYPKSVSIEFPDGKGFEKSISIEDVREWGPVDAVLVAIERELRVGSADSNVNHIAPRAENWRAAYESERELRKIADTSLRDAWKEEKGLRQKVASLENKLDLMTQLADVRLERSCHLEKHLSDIRKDLSTALAANQQLLKDAGHLTTDEPKESPLGNALAAMSSRGSFMDEARPKNMLKGGR
jgi:hypothetical protein